jgi:hypothetical protein
VFDKKGKKMIKNIFLIVLGLSISVYATSTVTDGTTVLEWQNDYSDNANNIKQSHWINAIAYCEGLSLNGTNWRLPNINELLSLVEDTRVTPSISTAFTVIVSARYWSSTSDVANSNRAIGINFDIGNQVSIDKNDTDRYVRCVRTLN